MKPQDDTISVHIRDAVEKFQDHEGINIKKVRKWIGQFRNEQELAGKMLKNINYYSGSKIREIVEKLVELACQSLKTKKSDLVFVPIGDPYGGSNVVARAIRGIEGIRPRNIKYMTDLGRIIRRTGFKGIVFIDDFSGTGDSIIDWWKTIDSVILPWKLPLFLGFLVLNCKAKDILKHIPIKLIFIDYLNIKANVLSDKSSIFTEREKKSIEKFCRKTRCHTKFLRGYGDCGLILAFKYGCPNNSLPVLWHDSEGWEHLFKRRAI